MSFDDSAGTNGDGEKIAARPAALLSCIPARRPGRRGRPLVVLTLGGADGSVDQIALEVSDAKKLLHRLALLLQLEVLAEGPAHEPIVVRNWCVPHSLLRAKLTVLNEEENCLAELRQAMPELHKFINDELAALGRMLSRSGKTATRPTTMVQRVKQAILIAVDTARTGT